MELIAYLNDIYTASRLKISDGTIEQMQIAIGQVEKQLGRTVLVEELNGKFIISHLKWLQREGKSPGTQRSRRSYLLALWRDAFATGYNTNNPLAERVPAVQEPKRKPRAWALDDLRKMLDQAELVDTKGRHHFGPKHWKALLLLIYYTGLRITAALKLRLDDLQGDVLYVPADIQKDNEEMVISLPHDLVILLHQLKRPAKLSNALIPWPWRLPGAAAKLTRYIIKPAGLPVHPKLKFHGMSRTMATIAFALKGKDAAREMLGHSSVKVTERYIADASLVDPTVFLRVQSGLFAMLRTGFR